MLPKMQNMRYLRKSKYYRKWVSILTYIIVKNIILEIVIGVSALYTSINLAPTTLVMQSQNIE